MKNKYLFFLLVLTTLSFTSCIQDEAPNAECDIVSVDAAWLEVHKEITNGKPIITNNLIKISIKEGTPLEELENLEPVFMLTPGAKIEKIGEPVRNGESGVIMHYRIYSEDGNWSKEYKVTFTIQTVIPTDKVFSFENYSLDANNKYYVWSELINNTQYDWWSSGNDGYKMAAFGKPASAYPTAIEAEGFSGNCIKLTTCKTNGIAASAGMPIAAGNIFLGEFDNTNAMKAPLEATRFGLQIIPAKPISMKGYYKYTPGETFTDVKNNVIENRRDTCAIYSVLFEVDPDNFIPLNGKDITSSNRIVLIAEIQNPGEPTEWTEFNIPFESRNGKEFDYEKLANNEYAITVVASSSKSGAFFEGAIGSTLYVDELKIEWEEK